MNGIRIWLDMSTLFSGVRQQSCVFVNYEKYPTVKDVEDHIRRIFSIDGVFHILNDGYLLPPCESSFLLRDNDTLSIISDTNQKSSLDIKQKNDTLNLTQSEGRVVPCSPLNITTQNAFAKASETEKSQVEVKTSKNESIKISPCQDQKTSNQKPAPGVRELITKSPLPVVKESQSYLETTVKEVSSTSQTSVNVSTPSVQTSNGHSVNQPAGDNDIDTNSETDSGRKRKRIRRRKKKPSEDTNGEPKPKELKQSPYILNKYIQGVSHILNSSLAVSSNKKHIFFQDEHEKTDANVNLPKCSLKDNENVVPKSSCTGGDLSKLMSLGNQKGPAVFERKKIDQATPSAKPETPKPALSSDLVVPTTPKLITLDSMPVKETIIKFKILKMVNYSPVLSEEITARVISPDFTTNNLFVQILEGLNELQTERGKFSLDDEGEEIDAVPSEYMYLNFPDLIEPKSVQYQ